MKVPLGSKPLKKKMSVVAHMVTLQMAEVVNKRGRKLIDLTG